jgi:hypothetical protein
MAADIGQEEHDRDAVGRGRALTALVRPYLQWMFLFTGQPMPGPLSVRR